MTTLPQSVGNNPSSGGFSTRSPTTGTLSSTPAVNDLVIFAAKCDDASTPTAITVPAGWFNLLGGTTVISSGVSPGHSFVIVGHWYTADEFAANTRAWTLTNLFDATQSGRRGISVIRGVNSITPVGNVASASGGGTAFNFPNITPLVNNSLTCMFGAIDAVSTSRTVSTPPAPWTDLGTSTLATGGLTATLLHYYNPNANVAATPVSGPALTISGSDLWIGILLELLPTPDATDNYTQFFAFF